jgi:hypothetical protein
VEGLAQRVARNTHTMRAMPEITAAPPSQVQNGSPVMKLLLRISPVPWPTQTRPVAMRMPPPISLVRAIRSVTPAMLDG